MSYISWGIIGTAILTIILVALQDRSSGVGGAFGSSDAGGFYQRRRGVERFLFGLTIIMMTGFVSMSLLNLTRFGRGPIAPEAAPQAEDIQLGDIQVETSDGSTVKVEPAPAE